ncbi:glutamine--fructose-6-phosphate transaminase (isomerizing) [Oscillospiraceae bacterium LTW-04]|nr:glutamine--fructose-6-phosphate transaminase (isomerizing) [Oscillospiraceae bacterium MB24-C1]
MCGIIGYSGHRRASDVLLDGLSRLEYRGYDSAGILVNENSAFVTVKREGRLDNLKAALEQQTLRGTCGMGHTRWATHGGPTDENAHPHGTERVMLVHNGIIENYLELKSALLDQGYTFLSQTDTEIAACYLDYCYHGDPIDAIREALLKIEGAYAFVIMFSDHPDTLFAVRKDGPLIAAPGDGENFLASDITAVIGYTNRYFVLDEGEIAMLNPDSIRVFDLDGNECQKVVQTVNWSVDQAQKEGYEHFMLKEIHEQPDALRHTLAPRIKNGLPCFAHDHLPEDFFSRFSQIKIVACGTAMHAGLIGRDLIEKLARVPVQVDLASEFRYRSPIIGKHDLVIIVSQSGETADSLAALRLAKSLGVTTLAIVNVAGSSIAREADHVILTYAGPEISVASTKAYSVQLAVFYLIAFSMAAGNGLLTAGETASLTASLNAIPDAVRNVFSYQTTIERAAEGFESSENLFFLGRGLDWALACEGSLKLKEISYIHCEACAAGELKHGTISLVTNGTPVIALCTQDKLIPKMLSNIKEVKARGAVVTLVAKKGESVSHDVADTLLLLDALDDMFMPFVAVTVLQLIAYYTARLRGCDIDKPRNLAKSVTVE